MRRSGRRRLWTRTQRWIGRLSQCRRRRIRCQLGHRQIALEFLVERHTRALVGCAANPPRPHRQWENHQRCDQDSRNRRRAHRIRSPPKQRRGPPTQPRPTHPGRHLKPPRSGRAHTIVYFLSVTPTQRESCAPTPQPSTLWNLSKVIFRISNARIRSSESLESSSTGSANPDATRHNGNSQKSSARHGTSTPQPHLAGLASSPV